MAQANCKSPESCELVSETLKSIDISIRGDGHEDIGLNGRLSNLEIKINDMAKLAWIIVSAFVGTLMTVVFQACQH